MPEEKVAAPPAKAVRIEVFDIQGHNDNRPLDYAAFFKSVSDLDPQLRREELDDRVLAIPAIYPVGKRFAFVAYSGTRETTFLVLDLTNDKIEVQHLETGKVLATRTVGIIDPGSRRAAVQYSHRGVRAAQVAALFQRIAQTNLDDFKEISLEFAPVPRKEFARDLAALERITSAAVKLTRPNVDWDDFSTQATAVAKDSGAHNIEIAASASRNGTLNKSSGIIHGITEFVAGKAKNIMKSATVSGFKGGGEPLTTLNLNRYIEARKVNIPLGPDGLPNTTNLITAGVETLDQTPDTQ